MSVYVITEKRSIDSYLKGESLSPIWERTEQTEAQKKNGIATGSGKGTTRAGTSNTRADNKATE
jgi:hypothetical protein